MGEDPSPSRSAGACAACISFSAGRGVSIGDSYEVLEDKFSDYLRKNLDFFSDETRDRFPSSSLLKNSFAVHKNAKVFKKCEKFVGF